MKINEGCILKLYNNYFLVKQLSIKKTKAKVLHSFRNKEIVVKVSTLKDAELVTKFKFFEIAKESSVWIDIITKNFKQLPKEKIEEAKCIKRRINSNPIRSKYIDEKIHNAVNDFILENSEDEE